MTTRISLDSIQEEGLKYEWDKTELSESRFISN